MNQHSDVSWLKLHLLVEVLVDFPLVRESQHATDHTRVLDGPSQVADLGPAVSVSHLHHALHDGQLLLGRDNNRPESHLLDLVVVHMSLVGDNQDTQQVFNGTDMKFDSHPPSRSSNGYTQTTWWTFTERCWRWRTDQEEPGDPKGSIYRSTGPGGDMFSPRASLSRIRHKLKVQFS